jgi:hypothetical protein
MRVNRTLQFVAMSSLVLLGACSSTKEPPAGKVRLGLPQLMAQGAAAENKGLKVAALRSYEETAQLYPASKLPWLRIARIQFHSENYGEAIVAAQQVVARDDSDKVARSILSVSGLRVAAKAVADLSKDRALVGSVRIEAQELATVLRESLRENVLVPVQAPPAAPVARPRAAPSVVAPPKVPAVATTGAATAAPSTGTGSAPGNLNAAAPPKVPAIAATGAATTSVSTGTGGSLDNLNAAAPPKVPVVTTTGTATAPPSTGTGSPFGNLNTVAPQKAPAGATTGAATAPASAGTGSPFSSLK